MPTVVRPARADELARAEALVVRSINDLTQRHGFGAIATSRTPDFQAFCLRDDPRGAWVAEDGGDIAGFALSWTCDRLWFLAELFVAPGVQGQGIGNELLDRTLRHASDAGASERSLITFAFNVVSQGLYARHGLRPRVPLHLCSAPRESVVRRLPRASMPSIPIGRNAADFEMLRRIDMAAMGISREKHHRYLLDDPAMKGAFLEEGGECVGYAYVSDAGHVGPMAVMHAGAMPAAFSTALAIAAAGNASSVSAFVPGPSDALGIAAGAGMRLALPMVLMSVREFGNWNCYLPRNPGFM